LGQQRKLNGLTLPRLSTIYSGNGRLCLICHLLRVGTVGGKARYCDKKPSPSISYAYGMWVVVYNI
jgi:hypothetical protein